MKHIKDNKVDGDIVETGVYRGANLILIKNFLNKFHIKKKIFAYDTYSGQSDPSDLDYDITGKSMVEKFSDYKKKNIIPVYCSLDDVKNNILKYSDNKLDQIIFIKSGLKIL